MSTICVIGGAGYVGLITGVGLAALGNRVVNVDTDGGRVRSLMSGVSPIHESGLEPLLRDCLAEGSLSFTTDLGPAAADADIVFIAVGTPALPDGRADLSQVIGVAEELATSLRGYTVVAIKSTVPFGTVESVREVLGRDLREGVDFDLVSNPEFLREGDGLSDFFNPERLVVGADSPRAAQAVHDLYTPLVRRQAAWPPGSTVERRPPVPVMTTNIASAQMIKYASNAFLATRLSFINEIAGLCERVGADVRAVADGMGQDPRIGRAYLDAGLGFGGPCLEKDLTALIGMSEYRGYEPTLLRAVLERNNRQLTAVVARLRGALGDQLIRKVVAVLGLAFKPGTNDVRNSLSTRVIELLDGSGATVRAHDPLAIPEARALMPDLAYLNDPYEAATGASALLLLTDWPEYASLDPVRLKAVMAGPVVVDARNALDGDRLREHGFTYIGVGIG